MSAVTALIPTWNRRALLERLVVRLREQARPPEQILVVDNGSSDGSADAAARLGARVIRMEDNLGFSRAVNCGIESCSTDWIAIVNNDVEPAPEWLDRLLEAAERRRAWFAAGKILNSADRERIDGTYDLLCRGGCPWRAGHGRRDGGQFSKERPISVAPATAALFRTELFRRVGLFDEAFGSYLEDVEFGIRCALAGCQGVYVPTALAWHEGSATLGRWNPEVVRLVARNQVLLVARHYSRQMAVRYLWPVVVAQALWGLLAVRHGTGRAWLRGKAEGIRLFAQTRGEGSEGVAGVLEAGEREIRSLQRQTGFDWYWRVYFLLTAGGAK